VQGKVNVINKCPYFISLLTQQAFIYLHTLRFTKVRPLFLRELTRPGK